MTLLNAVDFSPKTRVFVCTKIFSWHPADMDGSKCVHKRAFLLISAQPQQTVFMNFHSQGILITRPLTDSLHLAKRLRRLGYHLYIQPLLSIESINAPAHPFMHIPHHGIFTSAHGVQAFDVWKNTHGVYPHNITAWFVGSSTASFAKHIPFAKHYVSAINTGADLKHMILQYILQHPKEGQPFVHYCGQDISTSFSDITHSTTHVLYKTQAPWSVRSSVLRAFSKNRIQHVILLSQKTARIFKECMPNLGAHIHLYGLGPWIKKLFPKNPTSIHPTLDAIVKQLSFVDLHSYDT